MIHEKICNHVMTTTTLLLHYYYYYYYNNNNNNNNNVTNISTALYTALNYYSWFLFTNIWTPKRKCSKIVQVGCFTNRKPFLSSNQQQQQSEVVDNNHFHAQYAFCYHYITIFKETTELQVICTVSEPQLESLQL